MLHPSLYDVFLPGAITDRQPPYAITSTIVGRQAKEPSVDVENESWSIREPIGSRQGGRRCDRV